MEIDSLHKKKKPTVDYAAIIREYEMYGRGRSLKSSTFVGMNDEMKLRLAYAEIARLKDDLATGQPQGILCSANEGTGRPPQGGTASVA